MIKKYITDTGISTSGQILLLFTGILLFVFSLPHAMALRKLLLLSTFLISLPIFWKALHIQSKQFLFAVVIFLVLQVWMLVIAEFISTQPSSSFVEWEGQWLPVIMSLVIGTGVACTIMQSKLSNPRVAVALIILIPIISFLTINAIVMIHDMILAGGFPPNQVGITDEKGITNYLIALMEPILIADMLGRMINGEKLMPIPNWVISAILILAFFSLFAASSRNGLLIMLLAFVIGSAMMVSEIRKKYSLQKVISSVILTLFLASTIAIVSFKTDPRWHSFTKTIPIAWNIDHDLRWLNSDATDIPSISNGQHVDPSEYYRIAWMHEGLRMLIAHPWGIEISRDTFHDLEFKKYGHAGMSHSHNSWIDLGLNIGIQGLLLWAGFLIFLARAGWQRWKLHKEPLGLALALMIIMFALRGLLDAIFRNHMIEQFMLVAMLLFTTLLYKKPNDSKDA